MPSETYYDILEVKQDAPVEEIREAFYRLAYKYHPENNTKRAEEAAKNFQKVQTAFFQLEDAAKRAEYDALLRKRQSRTGRLLTILFRQPGEEILQTWRHIYRRNGLWRRDRTRGNV
ncbi:DnaJ domain-containing protein [Ustulina deusta]|nr:DnaJ domain-containing protein [Ustulina deusta]